MPDYTVIPERMGHHPFALIAASNDLIFVTGIASPGDTAAEQARRILAEIARLLEEVGSSLSEIVHLRTMVSKREYLEEVNQVVIEVLPDPKPAAGLVIGELVAPELKVEFEAIAQRGARMVLADA
ncbi:MAG TPA: Rid family hydrolase [Baekduia sp.]|nr:Rid family hydrolase [Baekduia sp.]